MYNGQAREKVRQETVRKNREYFRHDDLQEQQLKTANSPRKGRLFTSAVQAANPDRALEHDAAIVGRRAPGVKRMSDLR